MIEGGCVVQKGGLEARGVVWLRNLCFKKAVLAQGVLHGVVCLSNLCFRKAYAQETCASEKVF